MEALEHVPIFEKLDAEQLDGLRSIAVLRSYPAAATIFWQDDVSSALYVIVSGSVKVYRASSDGKEKILQILGPNDILGELALLDGQPRSATAESIEPTRMLVVQRKDFERYVLEHPDVLWKVQQVICGKLRRLSSEILDTSYRSVRHRLVRTLLDLAARHGKDGADGRRIEVRLTHRDLAGIVGSNRETVTRIMSALEAEGHLQSRGGAVLVLEGSGLERLLEEAE